MTPTPTSTLTHPRPSADGFVELPPDLIDPPAQGPGRPAGGMGDLETLALSLVGVGLTEPVVVEPHPDSPGRFRIVAGERRLAAAVKADLPTVAAVVRTFDTNTDRAVARLADLHHEPLHPLDVAGRLRDTLTAAESDGAPLTQAQLAGTVGRSQTLVSQRLRLLDLPPAALSALRSGAVTVSDAEELCRLLPDTELVTAALEELLDDQVGWDTAGQAVGYHLQQTAHRHARRQALEQARAAGLKVVDPTVAGRWPANTDLVAALAEKGWPVPPGHAGGYCAAVHVDPHGNLADVCVDVNRHRPPGERRSIAAPGSAVAAAELDGPRFRVWRDPGLHPVRVRLLADRFTDDEARLLIVALTGVVAQRPTVALAG